MDTLKNIKENQELLAGLDELTKVYGELALLRMRQVRDGVLRNREFLGALQEVFAHVQAEYLTTLMPSYKEVPLSKIRQSQISVLQHNGLTVCVLISANNRLYGDILKNTYEKFIREVKETKAEATILGRVGLNSFKEDMASNLVTYFEFPDDHIDRKQLGEIVDHLVQYETVKLFYPTFHNVFIQEPKMMEISASQPMGDMPNFQRKRFHFEPSLAEVMAFFEQEIFGTFLEQTMREAQLSKFAARASSMDHASENIERRNKELNIKRRFLVKRAFNKKQLSLMAAYI